MPRVLPPLRLPLGPLNPYDPAEVRARVERHVDHALVLGGGAGRVLYVFRASGVDVVALPDDVSTPATVAAAAARPDVLSAVVVAPVAAGIGAAGIGAAGIGAAGIGLVAVDRLGGRTLSWWASWRPVPPGEPPPAGAWRREAGEGAPPPPWRDLVEPSPGERPAVLAEARPPPVRVEEIAPPAGGAGGADALLRILAAAWRDAGARTNRCVVAGDPGGGLALRLLESDLLPVTVEDAARELFPVALAGLAAPCVGAHEGRLRPALWLVAEVPGERVEAVHLLAADRLAGWALCTRRGPPSVPLLPRRRRR